MKPAWRQENKTVSLSEVNSSIPVSSTASWGRKMLAFFGPGLMVAVGYMDPGNWATDLAGGAKYGYILLSVILFSNFLAILLQHLALKLGIVTGRDLAQACRDSYNKPVSILLWLGAEIAIASTDLAEIIGAAIALNLLFHLPIIIGILLTAFDVLIVLFLQKLDYELIFSTMKKPSFLFDGRLTLDHDHLMAIGFNVFCIGKKPPNNPYPNQSPQ